MLAFFDLLVGPVVKQRYRIRVAERFEELVREVTCEDVRRVGREMSNDILDAPPGGRRDRSLEVLRVEARYEFRYLATELIV